MAACRAFPEHACAIGGPGHQCKAGKRRRRNRRPLHHARQRALSIAFQVISGRYEFDQQEGRARARVDLRKTRSKTCLTCVAEKYTLTSALTSCHITEHVYAKTSWPQTKLQRSRTSCISPDCLKAQIR